MIAEERRQREREQMRDARLQGQQVPPPDVPVQPDQLPQPPVPEPVVTVGYVFEEPLLAPCESEILGFILRSGSTVLQFNRDSRFYMDGEDITVADFIDGILAEDQAEFFNSRYRKVYDEYYRMYDEGLLQAQIQTRLQNSMDEEISSVANELLIDKYEITVQNYEKSLTAESTRLVQSVPKAMLGYQSRKLERLIKQETALIPTVEDPTEILQRIFEYNKAKTRINNELGRV